MRTQDSVAKILEAAPLLNEALMRSKLAEYAKGGLPSGGSDGRGSAEKPLPLMGNVDRSILMARREYEQNLTHAALALDSALRLQNAWCIPRTDDTEKAEKLNEVKAGTPCANVWCSTVMSGLQNDRPRNGRCRACDRHLKLYQKERKPEAEEGTATGTQ